MESKFVRGGWGGGGSSRGVREGPPRVFDTENE